MVSLNQLRSFNHLAWPRRERCFSSWRGIVLNGLVGVPNDYAAACAVPAAATRPVAPAKDQTGVDVG